MIIVHNINSKTNDGDIVVVGAIDYNGDDYVNYSIIMLLHSKSVTMNVFLFQ